MIALALLMLAAAAGALMSGPPAADGAQRSDPGSTFVCVIEAAAVRPPRDALTRI